MQYYCFQFQSAGIKESGAALVITISSFIRDYQIRVGGWWVGGHAWAWFGFVGHWSSSWIMSAKGTGLVALHGTVAV